MKINMIHCEKKTEFPERFNPNTMHAGKHADNLPIYLCFLNIILLLQ